MTTRIGEISNIAHAMHRSIAVVTGKLSRRELVARRFAALVSSPAA
jgi:hypothetical protein